MNIEFVVVKRKEVETSRKGTVYSVHLKSEDGHTLTLRGDSSAIFDGYPLDNSVMVKIERQQATLAE